MKNSKARKIKIYTRDAVFDTFTSKKWFLGI